MTNPMPLDETIADLEAFFSPVESYRRKPGGNRSALHWLTTLKAQSKDFEEKWYSSNRELRAAWKERDHLAAQLAKLREELSTAPRDGWSAQREARVDALLAETEPGDGG